MISSRWNILWRISTGWWSRKRRGVAVSIVPSACVISCSVSLRGDDKRTVSVRISNTILKDKHRRFRPGRKVVSSTFFVRMGISQISSFSHNLLVSRSRWRCFINHWVMWLAEIEWGRQLILPTPPAALRAVILTLQMYYFNQRISCMK